MKYKTRLFPGDTLKVGSVDLQVNVPTTITTNYPVERIPQAGIKDLPETNLRVYDLWKRGGHRPFMIQRTDLRCPCGSVYTSQSETHLSCPSCKRVWKNENVPE